METALLMMAARTVQRLLVEEAEERESHEREERASELGRRTRREASPMHCEMNAFIFRSTNLFFTVCS